MEEILFAFRFTSVPREFVFLSFILQLSTLIYAYARALIHNTVIHTTYSFLGFDCTLASNDVKYVHLTGHGNGILCEARLHLIWCGNCSDFVFLSRFVSICSTNVSIPSTKWNNWCLSVIYIYAWLLSNLFYLTFVINFIAYTKNVVHFYGFEQIHFHFTPILYYHCDA